MDSIQNRMAERTIRLKDGTNLPVIGQGTWRMGEDPRKREEEIHALQTGLDLGMTVIDTAEMYGEGQSEELVGEAIKGRREEVFLVSKVYPHNAGLDSIETACENSLKRLGTDYLDLYLLHWRGRVPLEETIEGMERLNQKGKIKRWGVSNFDTNDMEELIGQPNGEKCAINQVLYHLGSRGIEYDLLDWHTDHQIPVMAYSPLAQAGSLREELLEDEMIQQIAQSHSITGMQLLLAWVIQSKNVLAIPKAGQPKHAKQNAETILVKLSDEEMKKLAARFPAPDHKTPLDIV